MCPIMEGTLSGRVPQTVRGTVTPSLGNMVGGMLLARCQVSRGAHTVERFSSLIRVAQRIRSDAGAMMGNDAGKSRKDRLQKFDPTLHGGEVMSDAAVGREDLDVDAAFWQLLPEVEQLVAQSTHKDAATFDLARWLGEWLKRPQPALGGRRPAEMLGTKEGVAAVRRVLGAIVSGVVV